MLSAVRRGGVGEPRNGEIITLYYRLQFISGFLFSLFLLRSDTKQVRILVTSQKMEKQKHFYSSDFPYHPLGPLVCFSQG